MIGFITLIIGTVIICVLLNLLMPTKDNLNWFAIIASTIAGPIFMHIIGYLLDGPEIFVWISISFPISMVFSFLTAVISTFGFYFIAGAIKKRSGEKDSK